MARYEDYTNHSITDSYVTSLTNNLELPSIGYPAGISLGITYSVIITMYGNTQLWLVWPVALFTLDEPKLH